MKMFGCRESKEIEKRKLKISNGTWFCELVAAVQRWGCAVTELSLIKTIVLDSSCILATLEGGNSLITHNTNAEGTDEPGNFISTSYEIDRG